MIVLFLASVVVVTAILYFGKRVRLKVRLALSALAFVLINLPAFMFLIVGDKPLPGARTVSQEEIQEAAR